MYDFFSPQDLARVSRHTVVTALTLGVVGLVGAALLNEPWFGFGVAIGVALGVANFRLIVRSVSKVGASGVTNHKRPLAANTLVRLGAITVIALGLCFVLLPLGAGVLVGLGIFQIVLLANMSRSMLKGVGGGSGIGGMLHASFGASDDGEND